MTVEPSYLPYWRLATGDVLGFMQAKLNRWFAPVEYLHVQISDRKRQAAALPHVQVANAAMISVSLQSIKASNGAMFLPNKSELYQAEYSGQNQVMHRGFDYQGSLMQYGVAWLPDKLFNWDLL